MWFELDCSLDTHFFWSYWRKPRLSWFGLIWCDYDSSSHCCCHGIPPVQNLLHNLATTLPPSFKGWSSSREYRVHKARQVSTNPDAVGLRVGSSNSSRCSELNEQYITVAYSIEYMLHAMRLKRRYKVSTTVMVCKGQTRLPSTL